MSQNLEELLAKLSPEETPDEIDWDAPESGSFPPQVQPGPHAFIFRLYEEEPFASVTIQGKDYLQVNFNGEVTDVGEPKTIRFQRVNMYKHPNMNMASYAELMRSIGIKPEHNPPSPAEVVREFQGADGRAHGVGEVAWRFYCKTHEVTISTNPRSRKRKSDNEKIKDISWPKNADGTFQLAVTCPKCGSSAPKQYGREEFVRFFSPASDNSH